MAGRAALGVAALGAAYFLSQFYRAFLAVLYPELNAELGVTPETLSTALGVWLLVFALAQFPIGWALDLIGPRWTAALLLGLCGGGGAALFAMASAPWMIIAAMALIGLGCAPVLMASLYIYARSYAASRFALYTAILIAVGTLGNVLASAPLAWAAEAWGWRDAVLATGAATVIVAVLTALYVVDPPRVQAPEGAGGFGALLSTRALWLILPLAAVHYAPAANLRGAWSGPYLNIVFEMDSGAIGDAALAMSIAMAVGTLAYGPLDRWFGTQKGVAFVGSAVVAVLLAALAVAPAASSKGAILALAAICFFGVNYPVLVAHARGLFPPHLVGRGVTLVNFFTIGGSGVMQILSGRAAAQAGLGLGDAELGFSALFGFYAVSMVAALAIYAFSRDAPGESAETEAPPPAAEPAVRRIR